MVLGSKYWKLTLDSVAAGYPRNIQDDWKGLPSNIDAAFTWKGFGATYFFKAGQYWKFENQVASSGYPKPLSVGFPGIPTSVDTAFVWGGNDKIYFMKGSEYWKFDPDKFPHVQVGRYPSSISLWGLPHDIDAALQWENGKTYFFKNGNYWRFNDRIFDISEANPPFPRNAGEWWFGCPRLSPLVGDEDTVTAIDESSNEYDDSDSFAIAQSNNSEYFSNTGGDEDLDVADYDDEDFY